MFEAKLSFRAGNALKDGDRSCHAEKKSITPEAKISKDHPPHHTGHKDHQPKGFSSPLNDEIKRRRLSGDKFGKTVGVLEPKLPKPAAPPQEKREEPQAPPKASSQVVNQKPASQEGKRHIQPSAGRPPGRRSLASLRTTHNPPEAKAAKPIQAEAVSGDPQSLRLCCHFTAVSSHHTITWSRDGTVLAEMERRYSVKRSPWPPGGWLV